MNKKSKNKNKNDVIGNENISVAGNDNVVQQVDNSTNDEVNNPVNVNVRIDQMSNHVEENLYQKFDFSQETQEGLPNNINSHSLK